MKLFILIGVTIALGVTGIHLKIDEKGALFLIASVYENLDGAKLVDKWQAANKDDEEYIHLPGKTCEDAPPCPDGRPCVMAPPRCETGTCGTDPVPTCSKRAK